MLRSQIVTLEYYMNIELLFEPLRLLLRQRGKVQTFQIGLSYQYKVKSIQNVCVQTTSMEEEDAYFNSVNI